MKHIFSILFAILFCLFWIVKNCYGTNYTYTFTILPSDFNGTSYAAKLIKKTSIAVWTTDNSKM